MASEPTTISVEPGSEVDRLLDKAAKNPLRLVRGDERVRVAREAELRAQVDPEPERIDPGSIRDQVARSTKGMMETAGSSVGVVDSDDIWENYDPGAARESTLAFGGSWKDIDAEAFKAYIRERRRTKNRPSVRW